MQFNKKTSTRVTVCAMLTGLSLAAWVMSGRGEFGLSDVTAADDFDDAQTISSACTDPDATGFVPAAAYTVTWSAPARGSAGTPSATVALTSGINSDTAPSVAAVLSGGLVYLGNQSPKMKLAGLQCRTVSAGKLEVHGDGTDNTSFNIVYDVPSTSSYASANKVDAATSGAKKVIHGATGALNGVTSTLTDSSDQDAASNGEIVFGGSAASTGGSTTMIEVDVTNYNVSAGTDVETLTYTYTGS